MAKLIQISILVLFCTLITACSSSKKDDVIIENPEVAFNEGVSFVNKNQYKSAAEKFEAIEREHPASPYASEAMIRRAYAYYLDDKYDDAEYTAEDFIKQYPTHSSIPYMYYLKALCAYEQILDVGRDQSLTRTALEALDEVIVRFPHSRYAKDAIMKRNLAFSHLAGKEMNIGLFYLRQGKNIAALNRFKAVVDNYDTSIFVPEALYRLTEIYYALGIMDQAQKYAAVLGNNYKSSHWYRMAYTLLNTGISEKDGTITKKFLKQIW